jgi:hypothetical protein
MAGRDRPNEHHEFDRMIAIFPVFQKHCPALERFQAKRVPGRRPKMRSNKEKKSEARFRVTEFSSGVKNWAAVCGPREKGIAKGRATIGCAA